MIQPYIQTTYETCLACCLLQAVDNIKPLKISQKLELDCLNHSLTFTRDDFTIGHLDYIAKKFKATPLITTKVQKIDLNLLHQLISKKPIIYIDAYYPFGLYHCPHFVTVLEHINKAYKIFDTWSGKEMVIEEKKIAKGISSIRNNMKLCPQIIIIE